MSSYRPPGAFAKNEFPPSTATTRNSGTAPLARRPARMGARPRRSQKPDPSKRPWRAYTTGYFRSPLVSYAGGRSTT
jgi:hypothetical protein